MISWDKLLSELRKDWPEDFDITHVEANPHYEEDGRKRISIDYDVIIINFVNKYKDKYKPTVRIWNDYRVDATIEVVNKGFFEFPVTLQDENFDKRLALYREFDEIQRNAKDRFELKSIYDWILNSYRCLIDANYAQAERGGFDVS